jgi:hypothetical protein
MIFHKLPKGFFLRWKRDWTLYYPSSCSTGFHSGYIVDNKSLWWSITFFRLTLEKKNF